MFYWNATKCHIFESSTKQTTLSCAYCVTIMSQIITLANLLYTLFGAFSNLRKSTISFVMSVHMEQLSSQWAGKKNLILSMFRQYTQKYSSFIKIWQVTSTLHEDQCNYVSRQLSLKMRNVSDKRCRENPRTHFMFNNFLFLKSCRLWDKVEKYCREEQATDENMAHVHCMLDT